MRALILLTGAALGLAACSSNNSANSDMNNTAADNMAMDQNMSMDQNAMMGTDMNAADANAAAAAGVNPSNAEAVDKLKQKDAKTHDADTNLANGI